MKVSTLHRFKAAQNSPHAGFQAALEEIRSGAKTGHWIWYVFPQLAGLGTSALSQTFAIEGREEAREFLRDPEFLFGGYKGNIATGYKELDAK